MSEVQPITHVVSFSGGVTSWAAARLVKDEGHPVVLLFADTLVEDRDTYRFLEAAAANIGVPITRIADGRTPWQVFRDVKFIGNSRIDPCSKVLKRELIKKWHASHYPDPASMVIVVGLDAFEEHRLERFARREKYRVRAPLAERGLVKKDAMAMATQAGLPEQRLYKMGFAHANCGGACVKAGITQWTMTYRKLPELYAEWEREETELGGELGAERGEEITILKEQRNGVVRRLSLRQLRERIEKQPELLPVEPEVGGCGCAIDDGENDGEEAFSA